MFDERIAEQLDVFYRSRDVRRRRALVQQAVGAQPGEAVLDVGCGPGYYVQDLLEQVGDAGSVTGVDISPAMLAIARRRVEGRPNARLLEGQATALPVEDAAYDRALSVQVFEYLTDVYAGLAELLRVLRPGGRAVIWDIDWSMTSVHSSDPERTARMLAAWDRHLADPALPRTLVATMRRAGFEDVRREGHLFATTEFDPETFGGALPVILRQFLRGLDDVDQAEADAWFEDVRARHESGDYSFAVVQFCFSATKPR